MRFTADSVSESNIFSQDGYYVWCGTTVQGQDGAYYLYFSRWPRSKGFDAWVTDSEIHYAVSRSPFGRFEYAGALLLPSKSGYDADVTHNPAALMHGGKYYLYYMGTKRGDGWWGYRNNQRIGVAVSDSPTGPFTRFESPCIDVGKDGWDSLMTSNPTVTAHNGRFYMMYKGVSGGNLPQGSGVTLGVAVSDSPIGPFVKCGQNPVITNPHHAWAAEDPCLFSYRDKLVCFFKDFQGLYSDGVKGGTAVMTSQDGLVWEKLGTPSPFCNRLTFKDGRTESVKKLERPNIFVQDGRPIKMDMACLTQNDETFNVHIGLTVTD